MISGGLERIRKPRKNSCAVVSDHRDLAVHDSWSAHDCPPERLADGLMAEADAEDRHGAGQSLYQRDRDAGLARRAGSRRNDDAIQRRDQLLDIVDRDCIVATYQDIRPELAQGLIEVE